MLRWMVLVLCVASTVVVGCTELPPAPAGGSGGVGDDVGAGGSGGDILGGGGTGDPSGNGGAAGDPTTGVGGDECQVVPAPTVDSESNDTVTGVVVDGSVNGACVMGACSGDDPFDRWSITTCGGAHDIELTWNDTARDLDLYLSDSSNTQIGQSATPDTMSETIRADLQPEEQYIVEVQAFETSSATQTYQLEVTPRD